MFGLEGIFGLIILIADVWAIVRTLQSAAETMPKVLWIVGIIVFPVVGFLLWLFLGPGKPGK